ncbi:MAG: gluconolactonase [Candidatus Atribacteria bacterium]|nr:gluconolactonase [Candidatus Atribacteria bacterium]MDI3530987.1 gluconolactonase [Candidatus Atribacteria bacterium]
MQQKNFQQGTPEERKKYIIRPYQDVPLVELVKGSLSHLVWGEKIMVSFLTMKAGSVFDIHTHPQEQVMIVLEGYCDEIIEGKKYRVEKGDVIIIPPNVPHGALIGDVDCKVIDIFSPVREDYKKKFEESVKGR